MRKIEAQMNDAIAHSKNWKSANTSVTHDADYDLTSVYLHGHLIAEIGETFVRIFDGGYQSNTTKSRLNAIINSCCNALTDGIFQKDYCWYIRDNNEVKVFQNGYVFS